MRQWAFFYDVARASKKWFKPDKAVIALPPKGPKRRASWASCQGWMIPKFSSNQDQAKQFVNFITSPSVASRLALANSGFVVPRASTLKAMGSKGIIPALKRYEAADVLVPRPFHLQTEKAQHFIDIAISSYLSGQQSLATVVKNAKSGIKSIS
jgi:ABC-type glycerol-3-phosphate transport system substrate-binding protein